jgi:hypothetical protein
LDWVQVDRGLSRLRVAAAELGLPAIAAAALVLPAKRRAATAPDQPLEQLPHRIRRAR